MFYRLLHSTRAIAAVLVAATLLLVSHTHPMSASLGVGTMCTAQGMQIETDADRGCCSAEREEQSADGEKGCCSSCVPGAPCMLTAFPAIPRVGFDEIPSHEAAPAPTFCDGILAMPTEPPFRPPNGAC